MDSNFYIKNILLTEGYRNLSNALSIGTNIDAMSSGLKDYAKEKGYWDGSEPFDFAKCFTEKIRK